MKIGIISFWSSNDNYGQQLQCWALQYVLKNMGHAPFHIKYIEEKAGLRKKKTIKDYVRLLLIYPIINHVLWLVKQKKRRRLLAYNEENDKKRDFEGFRNKYICFSDKIYYGLKELKNAPPAADAYVTGSDQVWGNVLDREEYSSYFLNFGSENILRLSYAASFGMEKYPQRFQLQLKKYLSRFSYISCRERAGVKICESVGIKALQVLDPTLLLVSDIYKSIFSLSDNKFDPFIFVYSLNINSPLMLGWKQLEKFASDNNLRVWVTPSSGYTLSEELFENAIYKYPTIPEWINMIMHCELFIASSFHGIVFSILFHRPFIYIPVRGKWSKGNNRVIELLEMLRLENCIVSSRFNYSIPNINWKEVDEILSDKRELSMSYLNHALQR